MGELKRKISQYWRGLKKFDRFLISASLIYLAGVIVFAIVNRAALSGPGKFYILAFLAVLFFGRFAKSLRDWTPPILLILAYEYLRGLVPLLNPHVHYQLMIKFDEVIFGRLPTAFFQNLLFTASHLHWYDYASVALYSLHYVIPLIVALIFWLKDRKNFENYISAMLGVSYIGFAIYLLFPAAPPWLASQMHILNPPVQHITDFVISKFPAVASLSASALFRSNAVAAMPSLHAAYVLLTSLFVIKKFPKLWPLMIIYTLGVWFAVIYLGEHYFFDVITGAFLSAGAFWAVQRKNKRNRHS